MGFNRSDLAVVGLLSSRKYAIVFIYFKGSGKILKNPVLQFNGLQPLRLRPQAVLANSS
jgi:hypothetical protein